jgi:hypothetical protein
MRDEQYQYVFDPRLPNMPTPGFIGDYQDVWNWAFTNGIDRFNSSWIKTSQSDVVMTGIR